ncbi:hypothetical protein [Synechococcus sp. CS-205]|uniref:hypothetical protein n=1 Tax=Synechococcus sp. CS-205 TaxID=2847984 RepID=UPI00223BD0DA|nr:hypothetical protein [Synechococcus sp. CS-205]MCT0248764.1 hypothetical protein [Synechococcus sp. CS-205]
MTTIPTQDPDPIDAAIDLLETFIDEVVEHDGGMTNFDVLPAATLDEFVSQAVELNTGTEIPDRAEKAHVYGREYRLASLALRLVTEWAADERDRRQALVEQLNQRIAS